MDKKIKIQKRISEMGFCSRREAENLIKEKKVYVNNQIAVIGERVFFDDEIKINNQILKNQNQKFYILLNKPRNTICTLKDPQNRQTIYQWMKLEKFCFSIGRLDFNTTGVIIVTNDGDFANLLAHPSSNIEREYIATLKKPLSEKELKFLNSNFVMLNNKFSKQTVKKIDDFNYLVKLNEGRNHHVKNLFLLVDNLVLKLHRKRYGIWDDKNLKIGQFRYLDENEIHSYLKKIKSNHLN